jgi:hypothetical protein
VERPSFHSVDDASRGSELVLRHLLRHQKIAEVKLENRNAKIENKNSKSEKEN